jgi:regulatory helix-turn-helix LysR family protein
MDIYQLELFLAVMNSSSLTRAAEKVFLSPGAVSLQLPKLAAELRTDLFVRNGKRLIPTPRSAPRRKRKGDGRADLTLFHTSALRVAESEGGGKGGLIAVQEHII